MAQLTQYGNVYTHVAQLTQYGNVYTHVAQFTQYGNVQLTYVARYTNIWQYLNTCGTGYTQMTMLTQLCGTVHTRMETTARLRMVDQYINWRISHHIIYIQHNALTSLMSVICMGGGGGVTQHLESPTSHIFWTPKSHFPHF